MGGDIGKPTRPQLEIILRSPMLPDHQCFEISNPDEIPVALTNPVNTVHVIYVKVNLVIFNLSKLRQTDEKSYPLASRFHHK